MKKARLTILLICILSLGAFIAMKPKFIENNYFIPSEKWNDTDGVHINAHGGGIVFNNGIYYWYGEFKTAGTAEILLYLV